MFRDRNGRCGLLQSSHLGGFAARCALRAALRRTRGRPRSPNAGCTSTTFPPRLREPRPFFWAAFLSLRRLRCGKKSRGPGLLTADFMNLNAAPLEKIRVPGFFSGYFSLPAAIRRERKVPAAPRGSRDNAANRAAYSAETTLPVCMPLDYRPAAHPPIPRAAQRTASAFCGNTPAGPRPAAQQKILLAA